MQMALHLVEHHVLEHVIHVLLSGLVEQHEQHDPLDLIQRDFIRFQRHQPVDDDLARALRVAGNKQRLEVLQILDRGASSVSRIAQELGLSRRSAARHLAATMENNQLDLFGPGEYRKPFIDLLNDRFGEYAGFECPGGEPGYPCVRFFATKVSDAMASSDNKWVVEQIMDIEAPEMVRVIRKLVDQAANTASP